MTNSPLVTSYAFEEITEHTSDTNAAEDSEHNFQMIIALSASTSNKKKNNKALSSVSGKNQEQFPSATCQEASRFPEQKTPNRF